MGYYEGVNLALSYCDDCGYQAADIGDECPICGSKNLTKIDRMNGYLAYSRRHGESRMNNAKMAEIADRKSICDANEGVSLGYKKSYMPLGEIRAVFCLSNMSLLLRPT